MTEFHIYGPPGTGKTTWLQRKVEQLVREGANPNGIYLTSFSRAAARTLASRIESIPADNIGTLQSFGYRSLDLRKERVIDALPPGMKRPPDSHPIHEWNREHPIWAFHFNEKGGIDFDAMAVDDISEMYDRYTPAGNTTTGRNALMGASLLRHRLVPVMEWPGMNRTAGLTLIQGNSIARFYEHWKLFKEMRNLADFVDMVDMPYKDCLPLDGKNPVEVLIVDEAQDLTPLMIQRIIQVYENHIEPNGGDLYVAMDDDQTLYAHTGCDPEHWFARERVGKALSAVLPRSYRMPREVQRYSQRIIRSVPNRKEKVFAPKDELGEVTQFGGTYDRCNVEVSDLLRKYPDETFMLLGTMNATANLACSSLRLDAIPFWNPYRSENTYWNPIHAQKGTRTVDRIAAYLKPSRTGQPYTLHDLDLWKELVNKTRNLPTLNARNIEVMLQEYPEKRHEPLVNREDIFTYFRSEEAYSSALQGSVEWLAQYWRTSIPRYPLIILQYHGADGLIKDPRVIVGTIHSVKGGEVDNVVVFPDMSRAAMEEYLRNPTPMLRTMYVAVTRARKRVFLAWPKSFKEPHFDWPDWKRSKLAEYAETLVTTQ